MGNIPSRGGQLGPYSRPNRSIIESRYRSTIQSQYRTSSLPFGQHFWSAFTRPPLPQVGYENELLFELAMQRYKIQREAYFKEHSIRCALQCSLPKGEAKPRSAPTSERPGGEPRRLRRTSSDEALDAAAIALCRQRRVAEGAAASSPSATDCPSHREEYLQALGLSPCKHKNKANAVCARKTASSADAAERSRFWKRFFEGAESDGAEQALRMALEEGAPCPSALAPPAAAPPPQGPPCYGPGLPLQPPLFSCPQLPRGAACLNVANCPPGVLPCPVGDPSRDVHAGWGGYPSVGFEYSPPPVSSQMLPPLSWNSQPLSYQGPPQQPLNHVPFQVPTQPPPFAPQPPPRPFFVETLDVGAAAPSDLNVTIFSNNVITASVTGFQTHGQNRVRSAISKRWSVPSGVQLESIFCFLGNGTLVICSIPPPSELLSALVAPSVLCLGRPFHLSEPFPLQ